LKPWGPFDPDPFTRNPHFQQDLGDVLDGEYEDDYSLPEMESGRERTLSEDYNQYGKHKLKKRKV
jgi:hypothetical protein